MWRPPPKFDEYVVNRLLGQGQMGQVFLGLDTLLERQVAIKFISARHTGDDLRQRFLIEARAAARIQHPNVVSVYRVGELQEHLFLVSEFVRGKSLDQMDKPLAWERALQIGIQLTRGLAAAHERGVLHRDLKPANSILAEDGTAKLLDFGLAKLSPQDRQASRGGTGSVRPSPGAFAETIPPEGAPAAGRAVTLLPGGISAHRSGSSRTSTLQPSARPTADVPKINAPRAITREGAIMGTPDYMSPEAWRGETATAASDLYSLGALLYELCTGAPPFADVPPQQLSAVTQEQTPVPVMERSPDVAPRFAEAVDRCLRTDPSERFAAVEELRDALELVTKKRSGGGIPRGNPYRGLQPFDSSHRGLFFGRDTDIRAIVERLRSRALVLVGGDSGIGKSSVCRAGVLPAVVDGDLGENRRWTSATLTPGPTPAAAVAEAIAPIVGSQNDRMQRLIMEDTAAVIAALRRRLGQTNGLVLLIDQFEELTTQGEPSQVSAVCELLHRIAAGTPGVKILATARADHLTRLVSLPIVGEDLARAIHILKPLSRSRIRQVITGPAEASGVRFESKAMIDQLVASTSDAPGALPLLQFALAELWEARERKTHTITARALEEMGGVAGALASHADGVIGALRPPEREAAQAMLTRLVSARGVRVRRDESELFMGVAHAAEAMTALVSGRLVVAIEGSGGTQYEVAHEVLVREWATLDAWLTESVETRRISERVESAAEEWTTHDRERERLWGPKQLLDTERLEPETLSDVAADFVNASRRQVSRQRVRLIALVAAVPLLLATAYGAAEVTAARERAERVAVQLRAAETQLEEGRTAEGLEKELSAKAFGAFDEEEKMRGELLWKESLDNRRQARRSLAAAQRSLEAGLAIDRSRTDVATLFGELLLMRAFVAERDRDADAREELIDRLRLYDVDGRLGRRWSQPGRVTLRGGGQYRLERFVRQSDGRLDARPREMVSEGALTLDPGSYRLTKSSDAHRVHLPFVVRRGETSAIQLPAADEIPADFALVPAGTFTFGSTADEESRIGFFDAVPAHERSLPGFMIARREVTYADWIEYLETLPPEAQRLRTPGVSADGSLTGSLSLVRSEEDWVLRMQPGNRAYEARRGEPIRYATRRQRQKQDWLRFPVTGISGEDVIAYAAWLSETERVVGARLCTEVEWEKAARGADGRPYPHGFLLAAADANHDQTYGKDPGAMGPDEVGAHPASDSPYGVQDMAGNAFEWTRARPGSDELVLKGGSYFYDVKTNRSSNRAVAVSTLRAGSVGARICADLKNPQLTSR